MLFGPSSGKFVVSVDFFLTSFKLLVLLSISALDLCQLGLVFKRLLRILNSEFIQDGLLILIPLLELLYCLSLNINDGL